MTTNTTFDMTDLDDELDEANKKHNGHGAHGAGTDLPVSPPGNPMPNVRRFLANKYGRRAVTCWPAIEDPLLRSNLYGWFEGKVLERTTSPDLSRTRPAPATPQTPGHTAR